MRGESKCSPSLWYGNQCPWSSTNVKKREKGDSPLLHY